MIANAGSAVREGDFRRAIGYVAFLAGPSLIGFIGDRTGVLEALTVTAVLAGIGLTVAGSTRPLEPADATPGV